MGKSNKESEWRKRYEGIFRTLEKYSATTSLERLLAYPGVDEWELCSRIEKIRSYRPESGGAPETILALAGVGEAHCTNSGSGICVLSEQIGKQAVFTAFDPVVGRKGELARIDNSGAGSSWSLSPDGKKVAFVENLSDFDISQ